MTATVLVAPDSFKGTFTSQQVTAAIATGLESSFAVDGCPLADGGEGTMAVLLGALGGTTRTVEVRGPAGDEVAAELGLLDDGSTAIVEIAQASGLGLMPAGADPEAATTYGAGELIAAAVADGARRILVTLGGSATSDGGSGALEALADHGVTAVEIVALCDVTTPFEDAARVFGPQKGADPDAVGRLTARLHERAAALPRDPRGDPRTGAAGGLSGALWAALGAELVSGAAWVLDTVGFDERAARATAIVTGEGRLDEGSFAGKLVGEVTARGNAAGTPVHAVVGSIGLPEREQAARGLASVTAASTRDQLAAAGRALAARFA